MSSPGKGGQSKQSNANPALSEQVHRQIMDYFTVAINSPNREIRAVALEMVKGTSIYAQKQGARIPPTFILILNIVLGIVVATAGWYAFLKYPERIAYELTTIAVLIFLAIVAISLFLAGFLTQANFMKLINIVVSRWKALGESRKTPTDEQTHEK